MTTIGKYRIEAEIGHGGFGRVYRAFDTTVGRTVAIKILIADKDSDLITRFKREATATGKLKHANIITVYDYGQQDNSPYIVMEYLEGKDLSQTLLSRQVMTLLEKTSIMSQVADGLQYAHHYGIVHRDVKPANIMILSDATVKIMDFGIARVLRDDTTRLTQAGNFLGTLSYMAPEVFRGTDVNHLCDIFSYGVIYYELISGKHPFAADDSARVIYNITSVDPPLLNTLSPDCPPGLAQIIARAMHKDRELRYQSLEDLLFDLMPIRMQLQSVEAQGLIQKAEALFGAGKITEAQTVIKQVMQLDPNNTVVRNLRERVNRESQLKSARERCEQLIASGKEKLSSLQHAKAVEMFEAALRLDPDNMEAQGLLEQVRMAVKKRERAEALLVQAKRELQTEQITDAYRSILECIQYAPENEEAAALLKTIRAAIERRERQRRLDDSVAKVEELIALARLEEAEDLLSDLEISYPTAGRVKELLSDVRVQIQEKKRRRRLEEGLDPVRKLLTHENWKKALSALHTLGKEFPEEDEILSLSAHAQEQLLAQQKTEHIEKLLREARTANESHDFERALDLVKEGLRSYPGEAALETKRSVYEHAQAVEKACGSVSVYLDKGLFEEAKVAGQQALVKFPGEPTLNALVQRAESGLAEQLRQSQIKAIHDQAAASAAQGQFSLALDAVRNGVREFPGDASLTALQDRIQAEHSEHERHQAIAARVLTLQGLVDKHQYAEAVRVGRLALLEFPGEASIKALVDTAERLLAEEELARQISAAQDEARTLASAKDFPAALNLLRNSIRELGPVPALQELARSIEDLRVEHDKQKAIQSAEARARKLLKSREYAQVVTLLEGSLTEYPGEAVIESLLAEARELLAAEERSKNIESIISEARRLFDKGDFKAAQTIARSGSKTYPDDSRLEALAEEFKAAMAKMEAERSIRAALESAASLQAHGQFSNAVQLLEQALLKAPGRAELLEELARLQEKVGRQKEVNAAIDKVCGLMSFEMFPEALEGVQNALAAFPGEVAFTSLLEEVRKSQKLHNIAVACQSVEALRSSGDLDGARRSVLELSSEFPNEPSVAALNLRIETEIAAKQKQQEVAVLTAEIRSLLDRQDVETAITKLDEAIRLYPGEGDLTSLHAYAKEIVAARHRADAIADLIKQSKKLLAAGKPRETQSLLKEAVTRYTGEESLLVLLKRADEAVAALDKSAEAASRREKVLAQARSEIGKKRWDAAARTIEEGLGLFPNDAELLAELEQLRERTKVKEPDVAQDRPIPAAPEPVLKTAPHSEVASSVPAGVLRSRGSRIALGLGGLAGIGLIIWILLPKAANYDQQMATARSLLEQREFEKAIEALQQIPSNTPLYKQAQDLLTTARNGKERKEIDALLADGERLRKDGQNENALAIAEKVLVRDPSNSRAASIRNEINSEKFSSATKVEQEKFVIENLAKAEVLIKSGDLAAAKSRNDAVINVQPDDPRAKRQKLLIENQIAAESRMNAESQKLKQAKTDAVSARASDLAPNTFKLAQNAETDAFNQQKDRQWDSAAKKFGEAAKLYTDAGKEAGVELGKRTTQDQQRTQAVNARATYEQNLAKAKTAAAETKASGLYLAAENSASDAKTKFDRGDFIAALDAYAGASAKMQQAADEAARVTQQPQSAAPPPPAPLPPVVDQASVNAVNTARNAMDTAKRATPAGDTRKAVAEETRARQLEQDGKLADAATAYRNAAGFYADATTAQKAADESERLAVIKVMDSYKSAYETKNRTLMNQIFPKLPKPDADNLANRDFASFQVDLIYEDAKVTGNTAIATYRRSLVPKVAAGGKLNNPPPAERVVFNLSKTGSSWIIQSMERKP